MQPVQGVFFVFCWSWLLCQVVSNNIIQILYLYIFYLYFSSIVVDVVWMDFFVFGGCTACTGCTGLLCVDFLWECDGCLDFFC